MKYLIVLLSLILCKNDHNIRRITTEYANGYKYIITYHNNGFLQSKGSYKNGLKIYDWKTCDENGSCICEYYNKSKVYKTVLSDCD